MRGAPAVGALFQTQPPTPRRRDEFWFPARQQCSLQTAWRGVAWRPEIYSTDVRIPVDLFVTFLAEPGGVPAPVCRRGKAAVYETSTVIQFKACFGVPANFQDADVRKIGEN